VRYQRGNQKQQMAEGQTIQWPNGRRTDNTVAKRQKDRQYSGQMTEGQTIQWPNGRGTDNTVAK
jgi:hypothetical protein